MNADVSTSNRDVPPAADVRVNARSRAPATDAGDRTPHVGWTFGHEVFAALPSPTALIAPSGIVAEVNAAWCQLTGDDPDADVGRPLWQRFSPAERASLASLVERQSAAATSDRRPIVAGTQLRHADGRRIDVALRLAVTTDQHGPPILLAQLEPLAEERDRIARPAGTGDRQLAVAAIARAVASGGDLRHIAQSMVATVARASGCPLVGLWRRGSKREAFVLVDGTGFPTNARGRIVLDGHPDGLAGHTMRSRSVVVIGGPTGTRAPLPAVLHDLGVASGAAVGVYGIAGADALLTVCAAHNQPLAVDVVRFVAIVGDLLSLALQRESVDDVVAAERSRTTETARELELLRRRHLLAHDAANLIDWRWVAPTAVRLEDRVTPPPRWSVEACLDGGPQALVDAAVAEDAAALVESLNTALRLGTDLDCDVRVHAADGVAQVRLRGAIDRDRDGTVLQISGVAAVTEAPARPVAGTPDIDGAPQDDRLAHTAHDLNNLLAAVLGTAEQLVERGADRRRLTAIVRAGRQARELIAGLRPDNDEEHPLGSAYELGDVVDGLRPLLPGLVGPKVQLSYEIGRGARTAQPTRDEVERILLNLLSNSRDALANGGAIRIGVDTCIQLQEQANEPSAPPAGSWARLTVSDDGTGMTAAERSRALEPGFTTKRQSHHAGLGLASVRDSVAAAGGVIGIASAPRRGTTVEIYLPLATADAVRLQPLRPQALPAGPARPASDRRAVALVVDDEPAVRDLVGDLLARWDFEVTVASDGPTALARGRQLERLDLVVTDLRLPAFDGLVLGRRLRGTHRHAGIILLTGAPPSAPIADRKLRVVRKPFDWQALRAAVVSLTGASATPAPLEATYPAASG